MSNFPPTLLVKIAQALGNIQNDPTPGAPVKRDIFIVVIDPPIK
jgi:hypothetical protein